MHTLTITIGRNVGDQAMPEHRWAQFQNEARNAVRVAWQSLSMAEGFVEDHTGTGPWGQSLEPSYKVTLITVDQVSPSTLDIIRRELAELADVYGQDAIALTLGESELIEGRNAILAREEAERETRWVAKHPPVKSPISGRGAHNDNADELGLA